MNNTSGFLMKTSRKQAGFTQEQAAELLFCSVESISTWERGETTPSQEMIIAMVNLYQDEFLGIHALKHTPLGGRYLPDIKPRDLAPAILKLHKEMNDVIAMRDTLVDIGCDGVIDDIERPTFDRIVTELEEIIVAAYALIYSVGAKTPAA